MDPKPEGLWGPPSEAEVKQLIHQLQATEPAENDLRADAAFALGQLGSKEALEALIEALRDEDTVIRTEAAGALGGLRDSRAVEPLIRAIYDSQWEVRSNAALSLGALGDDRALPHLLTALAEDGDQPLRWPGLVALGVAAGLALGAAAVVVPLRAGTRALRRMEF